MAKRVFHELLARVGDSGRYQYLLILYFCFMAFPSMCSFFLTPFLFHQQPYTCLSIATSDCHKYVCALPQSQRSKFIIDSHHTFLSKFGDYRCHGQDYITLLQSVILSGGLVGSTIGIFLVRYLTHRKMVLFSSILCTVGITGSLFCPNLLIACLFLFLNVSGATIELELFISYVVETTSEELRKTGVLILYIVLGSSALVGAAAFLLISHWWLVLTIIFLLPNFILIVFWFIFLEQTPFELVINYDSQYTLQSLRRIANINGIQFTISEAEIVLIRQQYDQNKEIKRDQKSIGVLDLCRHKSLRVRFIILLIFRFLISFEHYSVHIMLASFASDLYTNAIIIGVSQIISYTVANILVNRIPRQPVMVIGSFLIAITLLPVFIWFSCSDTQACSQTSKAMQTGGLFMLKFIDTILLTFMYLYKNQLFPSQIRPVALQVSAFSGKLGIGVIPLVQSLFDKMHASIFIAYLVMALVMGFIALPLPETFGVPPPEMIQELEYKNRIEEQVRQHQE